MKITKAMGKACLRELESGMPDVANDAALMQLGWTGARGWKTGFSDYEPIYRGEVQTALAMCAAIAGVKPEDMK